MAKPFLVFDMDGVLVDVSESYRETICRTVEHFTGNRISRADIQDFKNQGGFNDDWKLSHHIIGQFRDGVAFDDVVAHFQSLFVGNGSDGLILRERWIAREGVLERLSERFQLAVFTGRLRAEAALTLNRFGRGLAFDPVVCMEDVTRHKPEPEGLLKILEQGCGCDVWYVGDTVDDARCARAAGVPFIGVAAPANPRQSEVIRLFQAENAFAVLEDINGLEAVLPQ